MYIFNPEHDLCLANGDIHFVPPESALAFGRDCASLVKFMQGLDDKADMSNGVSDDVGNGVSGGVKGGVSGGVERESTLVKKIVPWGWNSVLRERLVKQGYAQELLPTQEQIAQITELSHRSVALEALEYVEGKFYETCGNENVLRQIVVPSDYRIAAKTVGEVDIFLQQHRHVVLKAPLSGSGKGVRFVSDALSHSDAGWCRNLIARHGYVVVERRLDPKLEFAMLFRSYGTGGEETDSGLQFLGYSLFYTQNGAYRGNILASDTFIERQIAGYIPAEMLEKSRLAIMEFLKKRVAGKYEGFIGVDQFVCGDGAGAYCFNPVVEINFRMTMGLVARNIYDRFADEYALQEGSHLFEICRNEPVAGKYAYRIVENERERGQLQIL